MTIAIYNQKYVAHLVERYPSVNFLLGNFITRMLLLRLVRLTRRFRSLSTKTPFPLPSDGEQHIITKLRDTFNPSALLVQDVSGSFLSFAENHHVKFDKLFQEDVARSMQ